jgi:hypothetical protein
VTNTLAYHRTKLITALLKFNVQTTALKYNINESNVLNAVIFTNGKSSKTMGIYKLISTRTVPLES